MHFKAMFKSIKVNFNLINYEDFHFFNFNFINYPREKLIFIQGFLNI